MSDKFLFIAIPRTGSMSVIEALKPHGLHAVKYDVGKVDVRFDPERPLTTFYHASPESLIEANVISREWFLERKVFTFIRNPWDRMVSLYHYLFDTLRRHGEMSFEDFVVDVTLRPQQTVGPYNWCGLSQAQPQVRWLEGSERREFQLSRFEDMATEWGEVQLLLGITTKLPHIGASARQLDYQPYYYTPVLQQLVGAYYKEDVKLGGYTFD